MPRGYDGEIRIDTRLDEKGFNHVIKNISSTVKDMGQRMSSTFKSLGSSIRNMGQKMLSSVLGIAVGFIRVAVNVGVVFDFLMMVIRAISSMVNSIIAAGTKTSALKEGFENLKLSVRNAFMPLLQVALPLLQRVAQWLTKIFNVIGQIMGALMGQRTVMRATADAASDAADSTGKMAKNTKEAEKRAKGALAAFDEINVLEIESPIEESEAGGGAGAGAGDAYEMIEISEEILNLANKIREAFKIGDLKPFAEEMSRGIVSALDTAKETIANYDFKSIGTSIATFINGIDWPGILGGMAGVLSESVKGVLDLLIGFFQELDWAKLGTDIWDSIVAIITEIDWAGIISRVFELLGTAIGGLTTLLITLGGKIWEAFNEHVIGYFKEKIEDAGGDVWQGLLDGIVEAVVNIGTWIYDHIITPFIEGFKKGFGIASPSTLMAEQGKLIIDGLKQGLEEAWKSVKEWIATKIINPLTEMFTKAWDDIKVVWGKVGAWFSNVWSGIKTSFSIAFNAIKFVAQNIWNGIKLVWSKAKLWFADAFQWISDKWTNFTDNLKDGIKAALNVALGWVEGFVNLFVKAINLMIGLLNKISIPVPDIPLLGLDGGTIGFNIAPLAEVAIPRLAKGAVIPPNSQFLAMLGDQRSGRNLEAPEDLIRQIVREETANQEITINFAGNMGKLVREMKPYVDKENRRVGVSLVRGIS